jgi:hypothetical protein
MDAAAQTYLNSGLTFPQHDIGCMTVVDYTFTWNRTKVTANASTTQCHPPVRGHHLGQGRGLRENLPRPH